MMRPPIEALFNASRFIETYNETSNETSLDETSLDSPLQSAAAHHVGATEGGIFSGKSPLHTHLALFLIQATIIITVSRLIHLGLQRLRQPRVIAEVIGGICLGPSVLGNIPGFTETIFPISSLPFLALVSNIGLILYMFLVGLELDAKVFFGDIRKAVVISAAGIIFPFCMGVGVSYGLFEYLMVPNTNDVPFTSFMLFTGVATSITAFPILARILTEFKLLTAPVGMIAISAAAIDDACSWTILALVVSVLSGGDNFAALYIFVVVAVYALILLVPVRLLFQAVYNRFFINRSEAKTQYLTLGIFIFLFISAWITEMIGVHAVIGAFLVGLIVPRNDNLPIRFTEKIEDLVTTVFLPLFFASSGLKTSIGLLNEGTAWLWLMLIIFVACSGKILGCTIAAQLSGVPWREAWSIGFLMNTKGLVELIVLNIGLEAQVINAKIFTIMVVMALVTTFMTSPIISFLYPLQYRRALPGSKREREEKLRKEGNFSTELDDVRLLIYVDSMESVPTVAPLLKTLKMVGKEESMVTMNALKIIETNERSSSILVASRAEAASQTDPALQVASFIGNFIQVPTSTFITTSPLSGFGEEVNRVVADHDCNLIIIPWHYGGFTNRVPEAIGAIIRQAGVTTAMYINPKADRNSWFTHISERFTRGILVPFIGGADDREALKVALRLQRSSGVTLRVVHPANAVSTSEDDVAVDIAALQYVIELAQSRDIVMAVAETIELLEQKTSVENRYDIIVVGRSNCTADDNSAAVEANAAESDDVDSFSKGPVGTSNPFHRSLSRKMNEMNLGRGDAREIFGNSGLRLSEMAAPVLVVRKSINLTYWKLL